MSAWYIVTLVHTEQRLLHAPAKDVAIRRARAGEGLLLDNPVVAEEGQMASCSAPIDSRTIREYLADNSLRVIPRAPVEESADE
jgi:hypothetical protein